MCGRSDIAFLQLIKLANPGCGFNGHHIKLPSNKQIKSFPIRPLL